ncbi:MAG: YaiO family outer membrane beta-barrel protein [Candidatus Cloacimonadaceae bacterium]
MRKMNFISLVIMFTIAWPILLKAEINYPQKSLEAEVAYDYLTPDSDYDAWKSAEVKYYHKFNPGNTLLLASGVSLRDVTIGWIQAAYYRDWTKRLYTYTSLKAATESQWMGRLRLDNDINLKLGRESQFILVAGQSVIYYDEEKTDYILSVGGVYYKPHYILEGRYLFNRSDPGKIWSNTVMASLRFGTMEKYWTTLTVSTGAQAYLGQANLLEVNQNVYSIQLNQRIWVKAGSGVKFGLGYMNVEDGYEKYNFSIGWFHQLP